MNKLDTVIRCILAYDNIDEDKAFISYLHDEGTFYVLPNITIWDFNNSMPSKYICKSVMEYRGVDFNKNIEDFFKVRALINLYGTYREHFDEATATKVFSTKVKNKLIFGVITLLMNSGVTFAMEEYNDRYYLSFSVESLEIIIKL